MKIKKIKFVVEEKRGGLPYSLIWISLDGRLKTMDYESYKDILKNFNYLTSLGRHPCMSLNIHPVMIKGETE